MSQSMMEQAALELALRESQEGHARKDCLAARGWNRA